MQTKNLLPLLLLAGCGAYYHGTVVPYTSYNEVTYSNTNKTYSQKWALEDAQLYCNGGSNPEKGQPNHPFKVIEQVTTDYDGLTGEKTDKVVSGVASAATAGLLVAGAVKKDSKLALAGVGTGLAAGAVKGEYTTKIRFVCE